MPSPTHSTRRLGALLCAVAMSCNPPSTSPVTTTADTAGGFEAAPRVIVLVMDGLRTEESFHPGQHDRGKPCVSK